MAKKKNSQKKHTFKHAAARDKATEAVSTSVTEDTAAQAAPTPKPAALRTATAGLVNRDFSYVAVDAKRILWLTGGLVLLEVVLYYLMANTPLGQTIYNLVKV